MALYNKYRPQTFTDVVGQKHITDILKQAAKENHFVHAYLLVGPRGTGKTTTARLIAKSLECKDMDLIEIDAASNTGVDDMRDIIEKAQFAPTVSPVKTYIIDEVHMLSKQAFNALLKTLEEPPAHAYFILATTEVQKVPPTIISRCQRFDFHRIEKKEIISRLETIAKEEHIKTDEQALSVIAQSSDGSLRDAINIFDQVITDHEVTEHHVEEALGLVRMAVIEKFIDFLLEKKTYKAIELIEKLYKEGINLPQFVKETLVAIRHIIFDDINENTFSEKKTQELLRISNVLLEKEFKSTLHPLFELELLVYKITLGTEPVNISNTVKIEKISNMVSPIAGSEEYMTRDIDMSKVGIPTEEGIKERIDEIARIIKPVPLASAFKLVHVEDVKDNVVTFSVGSQFHYEDLKKAPSIDTIEKALKKVFDVDMQIKIILKKIEVEEKKKKEVINDALRIFHNKD